MIPKVVTSVSHEILLAEISIQLQVWKACPDLSMCSGFRTTIPPPPPPRPVPVSRLCSLVGYSVDGIVAVSASHLTAGLGARCRRASADPPPSVSSPPAKWPGVTSLRALLSREKDDDGPQLTVLLAEVFAAVYTSLLITAIACSDARVSRRAGAECRSRGGGAGGDFVRR